MCGIEIDASKKLVIIQLHALVCAGGRKNPWKIKLARELGVKPGALTKYYPLGSKFQRNGAVCEALEKLNSEMLSRILGFKTENFNANHFESLHQFAESKDATAYAEFAQSSGCELSANGLALLDKLRKTHRRLSHPWLNPGQPGEMIDVAENTEELLGHVPIHQSENDGVSAVFERLIEKHKEGEGSPAVVVHAAPHIGLSYLLRSLLHRQEGFQRYYSGGVVHIYPEQIDNLKEIGRVVYGLLNGKLDDKRNVRRSGWAEWIAELLVSQKQLLVVHGASSVLQQQNNKAQQFVCAVAQNLEERTKKPIAASQKCSHLLLTVWNRGHFAGINRDSTELLDFSPMCRTGDEAFAYFRHCIEHYRSIRSQNEREAVDGFPEPTNNILKRVQHHYSERTRGGFTPAPSSVRFRAFCVTDVRAPSPFDPTPGIAGRLDEGLRSAVPEISMTLSDIQTFVRQLKPAGAESDLELIRNGSTALFFIRENMLEKIHERVKADRSNGDMSLTVSSDLQWVATVVEGKNRQLIIPLLARALVQDDWISFDPDGRTKVHEAIAEILAEICKRNDSQEMDRELPYVAPWGNRQIVFGLEAIRHYMRAARTAKDEEKKNLTQYAINVYETYLEGGMFSDADRFDGDEKQPKIGHLSRCYGMDHLKYEALCLLSEDGLGKKPPMACKQKYHAQFFREIGIALTHMLRPDEAIEFLEKAASIPGIEDTERAYILSHRIVANLELGKIREAVSDLKECKGIEGILPQKSDDRQALEHRNKAREAAIELVREGTPTDLDDISSDGLVQHTGERAILYIDMHLPKFPKTGKPQDLARAWMILKQARNHSLQHNFEHERVRLDIREAGFFRALKMPDIAVPVLERVGRELHEYGGSEIAFREFQLASAQVLSDLGKPQYAFATYALPAFRSLNRRHADARKEQARRLCQHLLDQMKDDEELEALENNPFRQKIRELDNSPRHPSYSLDVLPTEADLVGVFSQCQTTNGREDFKIEAR